MRDQKADRRLAKARRQLKKVSLKVIEDAMDLQRARATLEEAEEHGTIPWEVIKKELELKRKGGEPA